MFGGRSKVIRVRPITPAYSPGTVIAGVVLFMFWKFWEINWIALVICLLLIPLLDLLIVGKKNKEAIHIDPA